MEKNINELLGMCFDCESTDCALNNNGECRFPLVYERSAYNNSERDS